jgi:hypothetical protein
MAAKPATTALCGIHIGIPAKALVTVAICAV